MSLHSAAVGRRGRPGVARCVPGVTPSVTRRVTGVTPGVVAGGIPGLARSKSGVACRVTGVVAPGVELQPRRLVGRARRERPRVVVRRVAAADAQPVLRVVTPARAENRQL